MPAHHRIRRSLTALVVWLLLGFAAAAPPCGMLLSTYIEGAEGRVVPCLVDMTENGLCFRLPGVTLDAATRTLDAGARCPPVPRRRHAGAGAQRRVARNRDRGRRAVLDDRDVPDRAGALASVVVPPHLDRPAQAGHALRAERPGAADAV